MMSKDLALSDQIVPCGPVTDQDAAARAHESLSDWADENGWGRLLAAAWPSLAPVFGASPYLSALATRNPEELREVLARTPDAMAASLVEAASACGQDPDSEAAQARVRVLKNRMHLLTAIADLGGVWSLDEVTGALSHFADGAIGAALRLAAREAADRGRLTMVGEGPQGPVPGLFVLAMGKLGAFELNYSSDIDITVFHDPDALPVAADAEPHATAIRITERMAAILQDRTAEGYVFRVDLRLRPDPASTPVAAAAPAALNYYETVGQNWERAAMIKARVVAGDLLRGHAFLGDLAPFIWRRNLDFAAISDIHSIKRQIQAHRIDERLSAKGADLKLGRGGIREIEFYVQTQQLILGGRHPGLRSRRTLDALGALAEQGRISQAAADEMSSAYQALRRWEHRAQMVMDEQTHRLPEADSERKRIAALSGFVSLRRFDAAAVKVLKSVNRRYGELFAGEEPLSSRFGSLVFTGVEDDPETLATLARMGFSNPPQVAGVIRDWHHGHIAATRTERGRELFTRLAPRLLEAMGAAGGPDQAFLRFSDFFSRLNSGLQVQALFLAQPGLLALVVRIMAYAPSFALTLARHPAAMDALLDPDFFGPIARPDDLPARIAEATQFEAAMDLARRAHRDQAFRIAVQVLEGVASASAAGVAFTELADALISGLSASSLSEVERQFGAQGGEVAVIALGKCGSGEMTARSDLDLMTLYRPAPSEPVSSEKALSADTFYARFTHRLVAALSTFTSERGLYEVDLQLRPSGTKGPVAVSLAAFESYYAGEAETWELLAMTRARVVWATSTAFAETAGASIEAALRRPRDLAAGARDVTEMRALIAKERPANDIWDMKLNGGGLVDIEFCAQHLQLAHAAGGGPLRTNTGEALRALAAADLAPTELLADLVAAWSLQQNLSQLLRIALEDGCDPSKESRPLRALLARAGGARDMRSLKASLKSARRGVLAASRELIGTVNGVHAEGV